MKGVLFVVTERRTRCILGMDLPSKIVTNTTQKTAPTEKSRFDVLLCEQTKSCKQLFYNKLSDLFDRLGSSKNPVVNKNFKYPLYPIQEKGRPIPILFQDKVQPELTKMF